MWLDRKRPTVHLPTLGTMRSPAFWEPRVRAGIYGWRRSLRWGGASPFKALNVMRSTLKSMRNLMGSQWRDANTGVMCSKRFVLVRIRAAAF